MEVLTVRNPNCAKQDERLYKQWFQHADLDGDGRITGSDAIEFFSHSKLSKDDLKQVWALADSKRQGYLGYQEFVTAMQVISLVQTGNAASADVLLHAEAENISPPTMEGLDEMLFCKKTPLKSDAEIKGAAQELPSLMSRLFSHEATKKVEPFHVTSIIDGLKKLYIEKLKPLEVAYQFNDFALPPLTDSDFDAKPMVLLLGQYSTGKTTFLKHVLKADYPGAHIGPEPTTDRFIVVMVIFLALLVVNYCLKLYLVFVLVIGGTFHMQGGPDSRSIPGNTIAVQSNMPFTGLTRFGAAFLSKFECSQMPNSLLEHISFVDTPGVLSGEKQRTHRSYDFTGVTEWFASKSDLILLLFDPHKLDISDEFKRVISSLRGHEDKIRVILNKADQVSTQQLMRVYGALMWSLGKILNTPEVVRVYVGSFNDKPIRELGGSIAKDLLEPEQDCLLADLTDIPRKACDRKINEFVKRARAAKIHAYLISHLKKMMPAMMGKTKTQQRLIDNLQEEFNKVQREYRFPVGDFPDVEHFKEVLATYNIDKFEKLKPKMIQVIDEMVSNELPDLIKKFRNPYET